MAHEDRTLLEIYTDADDKRAPNENRSRQWSRAMSDQTREERIRQLVRRLHELRPDDGSSELEMACVEIELRHLRELARHGSP